jgi:tetratricopeptide (TPR) repeat protein
MNAVVLTSSRLAATVLFLSLLFRAPHCAAQQPSSADFKEAETLLQQHHLAEAKTATLDQLHRNPSSVEGYNLLGIIQANQQDFQGAIASFQKAQKLNPQSAKSHNNLGNVYAAQKQVDLAEREFRAVLRIDPTNSEANYNLGVLLLMKGSAAEAIPHFERVRPMTSEARFNLIHAYFQSHRTADALRASNELSEQAKSDVQVHFSLGLLLALERQYKAAQLELEKADALRPETFEILYNLGEDLLRQGNFAKAEVILSRALKLKPESPETLILLARVYTNQSRPLDALEVLMPAHKLAPENTDVVFLMAQISMSQNYYEDAIPLLESAVQLAPSRPDLLAALGESYFMAGKLEKAVDEFKQLFVIDKSARSYAFLGLSYRNLGRFDEAKQYFQEGLKLEPKNSTCLFNLGLIAERQGDEARAEILFQQTLRDHPDSPEALLELANLRIAAKRFPEAEELLRRYVRVSKDPTNGYYKLAMVERSLHETAAAERDLNAFKTMSKNSSSDPYPYEHLFDYLDNRSRLAPGERGQLDVAELTNQAQKHPDQPEALFMLSEAYLKAGKIDDALNSISQLDKLSGGDYRTINGVGVLLARYRLYPDAIQHFQSALQVNPGSDEVKFNLANAYFRERQYSQALETAGQVSEAGRKDDAYLSLLGDIYAHLGDTAHAAQIFRDAIDRNPDNDQNYLSLALIQLRATNTEAARQTLTRGQSRIPGSGKIYWGLGLTSAMQGNTAEAASQLERAIDLLPEWSGGYSTLGVFYFQIGKIDKAREVLNRFKESSSGTSLEVNQIEKVLDRASTAPPGDQSITAVNKEQLLQLALSLADRTL